MDVNAVFGYLTPPQQAFTRSRCRYTAYGGARGGGKTHVLRWKAFAGCLAYPGIRVLVVRREYPELEQTVILPMKAMIPREVARYNGTGHMFSFLNGSIIKFGHFSTGDEQVYQGQEYDWIFMDEATQFTEDQFRTLGACLRGVNDIPKRIYLTCNPGGVGHFWVKRLFVTREYEKGERPEDYAFIPATVEDNPFLMEASPDYVQMLDLLPEDIRRAHRYGDWDALSGVFFPEVRRESHLVEDFRIPEGWARYRAIDYGLDELACLWVAIDYDGRCYVYREVRRSGLIVSEAAALIQEMTPPGERIAVTLAPPDLWNRQKDTGRNMAEIFMAHGLALMKVSNDRVQGWMALKELLKPVGEGGAPGLVICESCKDLYDHLTMIQHDSKRPEDCAAEPHEITHDTDALRYFAVTRLLGAERPAPEAGIEPGAERMEDYDGYLTGGEIEPGYLEYD